MVHDLSPFILRFSDDFGLRWYGFSYVLGFIAAYFMMVWLVQRQRAGLSKDQIGDFITYIAFGTLIGGRLGYVLFYSPDLLWKFKADFPFWGVLAVNEGGMASHGGMIGIVVACLLFARRSGVSSLYLFDLCALSGPIGIFFGRLANFINGELVGRPAPPDFPLAVKFPQDIVMWPTQEFDRLRGLAPVTDQLGVTSNQWMEWLDKYRFDAGIRDQVYGTLNRIIHEIQNGNTAVKEAIAPLLTPRHPSQLYAAFGEGLFLFVVLFFLWRSPRKPGFISSAFVILYAMVRIADEFFRTPDAHIGFQLFGLTRGQWLSVAMMGVGIVLMIWWGRSATMTIPGWGRARSVRINRR
ncbi:MAG: prolipoprotein diacylglyceryl transferase [Bdellovibrionaceae bacterium]|nr:prolipoprotein diacylglyceryl transferase [Pseudobdellovibrionaceae bacterium]MBX3033128.1 prolipoprotein diacylglyceryl transferase [Pseudobdellovibrionaceae bacterium]